MPYLGFGASSLPSKRMFVLNRIRISYLEADRMSSVSEVDT
jgi:hypothetical protein